MKAWFIYPLTRRTGRGSHLPVTHRFMAKSPECPQGPHPTRECGCRPFKTLREAQAYVFEQAGYYAVSLTCADGTCPNGPGGGLRRCHATTCWCECHGPERRS